MLFSLLCVTCCWKYVINNNKYFVRSVRTGPGCSTTCLDCERLSANGFMKKQHRSEATTKSDASHQKKKSLLCAVKKHEQNWELDFIVLYVVFIVWWILAGAVRALAQNTYFLIIHLIGFVRDHFVHRLFDDSVFQRSFASRGRCIRIYVLHWPWPARHHWYLFSVRLRLYTWSRKLIFLAMSFRHALSLLFY